MDILLDHSTESRSHQAAQRDPANGNHKPHGEISWAEYAKLTEDGWGAAIGWKGGFASDPRGHAT